MKTELKRQAFHGIGTLFAGGLPLFLLGKYAIKSLAIIIICVLLLYWYIDKREFRRKQFQEIIKGLHEVEILSKDEKENMLQNIKKFDDFEEGVIKSVAYQMKRQAERKMVMPSFYALLGTLLAVIIFGDKIAMLALITLAVGDSVSTIIGKKYGIHKIFYNKEKSIEGSMAFFFSSLIGVFIFLFLFPSWTIYTPIVTLVILIASLGTLIESLPTFNDNISIPLGVSFFLYMLIMI